MRFLLTLFLLLPLSVGAATYTEFYVQTTGSNLNSGHTADDAATFTATGGFFTNNTSASVCTYFKSGLNPIAGGVTNGAWASIYPDGTTTNTPYVGLITAADDTADTITISLVAKSGTVPSSDTSGAGSTSIKVGGAWAGPNTNFNPSVTFPFGFVQNTMTNTSGNVPCVNVKSATYSVTNGIAAGNAGPIVWSGYLTSPRDGLGRATVDATWSGVCFVIFTCSGANQTFSDFVFANNSGGSGTAQIGVSVTAVECVFIRCTAHDISGSGFNLSGTTDALISCEAYKCNAANGINVGGFLDSGQSVVIDCMSYSNTTANSIGFRIAGGGSVYVNCVSYRNGAEGYKIAHTSLSALYGCDAYANGASGVDLVGASAMSFWMLNCNIFGNSSYGVNSSGSAIRNGGLLNCAFGSGTATNASGSYGPNMTAALNGTLLLRTTTMMADQTPWVDPVNGNFRVSNTASKSAGWGVFMQSTVNSPTNTMSYPDIGAAQSASTNATSGGGSYPFAQ